MGDAIRRSDAPARARGPQAAGAPAFKGSDEVARVRAQLAALQASQARKRAGSPAQGPDRGHEGPQDAGASVEAWAETPERTAASTMETQAAARIRWEGAGEAGEREVARAVARAFGKTRRRFASARTLHDAIRELEREAAWGRLQSLVKARERSGADLEGRLVSEGFPRPCAREAVERARRCQLVDDARFATTFARAKARSGWGRERVTRELDRLGVAPCDAQATLDELLPRQDEAARARELLARRRVPEVNPVPKLARFLAGRGFPPGIALSAAKERVAQEERDHTRERT